MSLGYVGFSAYTLASVISASSLLSSQETRILMAGDWKLLDSAVQPTDAVSVSSQSDFDTCKDDCDYRASCRGIAWNSAGVNDGIATCNLYDTLTAISGTRDSVTVAVGDWQVWARPNLALPINAVAEAIGDGIIDPYFHVSLGEDIHVRLVRIVAVDFFSGLADVIITSDNLDDIQSVVLNSGDSIYYCAQNVPFDKQSGLIYLSREILLNLNHNE